MQGKAVHSGMPIVICSMAAFVMPLMGSSMNVALPLIGRDLHMDAVLLGWAAAAYNLAAAVFLLPLGRLADLKGREAVFKFGLAVFTIFSIACALSRDSYALVFSRLFQGVGGAMILGTANAILSASYPKEVRGKVLGICITCVYLGMAFGPVLGGFMMSALGWRSFFGFVAAFSFVTVLLALSFIKNNPTELNGTLDFTGSVVYCMALSLIMFGFSSLPALKGWLCLAGGSVGFYAFGLIELKSASPLLDIRVFRGNIPFIFSNLSKFLAFSATFGLGFLLSIYLQYIKGLSPGQTGLVMVTQTVMLIMFSRYAGGISDKIEPAFLASAGLGLSSIGLGAFVFLSPATPVWFIIICLGIIGLGFSFFNTPITNAVISSVEQKNFGVASAVLASMRTLGMNFSMGIIMMLFSLIMGRTTITPENYGAFLKSAKAGLCIFTGLCLLAILSLSARGIARMKAERGKTPA